MFTVTDAASDRLAQKLRHKQAADDVTMRFVRRPHGWKLRLDTQRLGDVAVAHEGRTVLVMDAQVAERLADRTLDARETPRGARLCLR